MQRPTGLFFERHFACGEKAVRLAAGASAALVAVDVADARCRLKTAAVAAAAPAVPFQEFSG